MTDANSNSQNSGIVEAREYLLSVASSVKHPLKGGFQAMAAQLKNFDAPQEPVAHAAREGFSRTYVQLGSNQEAREVLDNVVRMIAPRP